MEEYGKTPEQKFVDVEFQILPTDYQTGGCPVFILEGPMQGGMAGLPKLEPMARTRVYLVNSPFHAGPVALILNIRTGRIYIQYHVVFNDTFSTVYHMRKTIVPGNWKNLVEEHSELTTQGK